MKFVDNHPKTTTAILVTLIALAGIYSYRAYVHPAPGKAVATYYDSVSDQVRHAAAYVKKGANVVVLVFDAEMRSPNNEPLKGMIKALEEENLHIQHVERLVMDVNSGWSDTIPGFPYDEYLRVARAYPKADAILSLCSAPYPLPNKDKPDISSLPPLLLMRAVPRTQGVSQLIDNGCVAMAVVTRDRGPQDDKLPADSSFEQNFEVLTGKWFKVP